MASPTSDFGAVSHNGTWPLGHRLLHQMVPTLFTAGSGLPLDIPGPARGRWLSTAQPLLPWGADTLGHAKRLFDKYGSVVALVRGGGTRSISPDPHCPGTVLAFGAEHFRTVLSLNDTFSKTSLTGALHPGDTPSARRQPLLSFGAGLFVANGDEHRRQRRLLMPAFSKRRLDGYCSEMIRQTQRELNSWSVGETRDIALSMRRLTANIVTSTLFGEHAGGDREKASDALQRAIYLMGRPLTRVLPWDVVGLPFRRYLDATAEIERQMQLVLEKRRTPGGGAVDPAGASGSGDILDALLGARDEESGTRLTEAEILGHVSVFFAAGHETSANALAWTLLLLAQHPQVYAQASAEVLRVLAGAEPTPALLEQMPYLGAVIKESLRLFPPAPWNGRVLRESAVLGDFELPAGSELLFSIYETHRDPNVFAEPLRFLPERWAGISPSVYEYNPFSAGPRTCIGAGFATLELKVVLALLLQRYRLALLDHRVDRLAELVLSPRAGIQVRVCPLDGDFAASVAHLSGNVMDMVAMPAG